MIDTKVDGNPSSVRGAAHFLDATLKKAADQAADDALSARRTASTSWEGAAANAYSSVSSKLVDAADEQARHASKAGQKFEEYAGRLERIQERMDHRRTRAAGGGLIVAGTVIEKPADAVPPADLPAGSTPVEAHQWDLRNSAFETQKKKVQLYNHLAEEVTDDWSTFEAWIDAELKPFWSTIDQSSLAEVLANALSKSPLAGVVLGLDVNARTLERYSKDAATRSTELADEAAAARAARRSGNPARKAAGEAVDIAEQRRAAKVLAEMGEDAGRFAKRIPLVGYALAFGSDGYAIAHGESPGKVVTSEGAGLVGGVAGGALVVAGAAAIGVGAPVIAVAAGAAVVGVGASLAAEYAWDHWVPDDTKEAIDEGLRDFGNGVKDVASDVGGSVKDAASDVGDAVTFWN
jgi:hypothetical protein